MNNTRKRAVERVDRRDLSLLQLCTDAQARQSRSDTGIRVNWDFNGPERQIRRRELSKTYSLHITNEVPNFKKRAALRSTLLLAK